MPCRWLERVAPRAKDLDLRPSRPGQELKEFLEGDFRANIELKTINRWDVGSVESSDTYLSCATQPFASQADLSQEATAGQQLQAQQPLQQVPLVRPRFLQGVRTKARFDPVDATRALRPDTIELPRPEPHVLAPSSAHRASPFAKVLTLFGGQSGGGKFGGGAGGDTPGGARPEQPAAKSILKKPEERTTASTGTATTPSLGALCVHTVDVMCSPVRAERTPLLTAQEEESPHREPPLS